MIPSLPLRVLTLKATRLALRHLLITDAAALPLSLNDKWVARYNQRALEQLVGPESRCIGMFRIKLGPAKVE